jgi:hypothetical protein
MVGVVSMETFDAAPAAGHTPGRPVHGIVRKKAIPFGGVPIPGRLKPGFDLRIRFDPPFHRFDTTRRFDPAHPHGGQRAGQPVAGWERSAVIEQRGNRHNDRQQQRATDHNLDRSAKWSLQLGRYGLVFIHESFANRASRAR